MLLSNTSNGSHVPIDLTKEGRLSSTVILVTSILHALGENRPPDSRVPAELVEITMNGGMRNALSKIFNNDDTVQEFIFFLIEYQESIMASFSPVSYVTRGAFRDAVKAAIINYNTPTTKITVTEEELDAVVGIYYKN